MLFLFSILWFLSFSFALDIDSPTSDNIDKFKEGDFLYLDDGINKLGKKTSDENQVSFEKRNNIFLKNDIYNSSSRKIEITCKNGYIVKIERSGTNNKKTYTWQQEQAILSYDYYSNSYKNAVTLKCKPIAQPSKKLSENKIDINYQTISTPKNDPFESLSLSKDDENWNILDEDVQEKLVAWKDISTQPSFTDILFLQLKTISNLSDSALEQNSNFDFKKLFQNNTEFEKYNKWIDKFSTFDTKKDFEDAFSGTITLKDVWISQDVIAWLYKCINNNHCLHTIQFKHNINDDYDVYSLDEISKTLYSGSNNILDESISYYSNLKNTCSSDSISDNYLKTQVDSICNKLLENEKNVNNPELYDLGYSLWLRVENLQNIKNNIPASWLNLKWIFNIYRELNNLTLGTNKIAIVDSIKNTSSLTGQYEKLRKIFAKDVEELQAKKIGNTESNMETQQQFQTALEALTPWTALYEAVKNEKPDINLLDKWNYEINNWVVQIKWVSVNNNTNSMSNNDNNNWKIKSATLIQSGSWPSSYTKLEVIFSGDDTEKEFYKIWINNEIKFNLLDKWWLREWTYINKDIKDSITTEFNKCYEKNLDEKCYFKKCFSYINFKKYKKCIDNVINKNDRVVFECKITYNLRYKCKPVYKKWNSE